MSNGVSEETPSSLCEKARRSKGACETSPSTSRKGRYFAIETQDKQVVLVDSAAPPESCAGGEASAYLPTGHTRPVVRDLSREHGR